MENEVNFAALLQEFNQFLTSSEPSTESQHSFLMLRNVLIFINKNFSKFNNVISFDDVLKVLHYSLRYELQTGKSLHIGSFVYALLKLNIAKEDGIQICLQILYQILQTLSKDDTQKMQIGDEIFQKLIELLLDKHSSRVNANILACLKLYVNKFNAVSIVSQLWSSIKNLLNTNQISEDAALLQILIQFFDEFSMHIEDFIQYKELPHLIQRLLLSKDHDHRKVAIFLLKKDHRIMVGQLINQSVDEKKEKAERIKIFCNVCIDILENLEENQSHLILPSLEQLKSLKIDDLKEQIWLNILYGQIMRHNNIIVRRWILEHLLNNLTFFSLTRENQSEFMKAVNESALYNVEGYMLPAKNIGRFLECNKPGFFMVFSEVNWKAVPLHYWLTQLILHWEMANLEDISQEVLMQLATKIRAMQNRSLRRENIKLLEKLFACVINDMEIASYVSLVEALYNTSDPYDNEVFCKKLSDSKARNFDGDRIFSFRFYQILSNNTNSFNSLCNTIKEKIDIYRWTIGYMRFLIFDCEDVKMTESLVRSINGDISEKYPQNTRLGDLYKFFENFSETKVDKTLTKQKVTDLYVTQNISSYTDLKTNNLDPKELLDAGSVRTLQRLTDFLSKHDGNVEEAELNVFVEKFREHFKQHEHLIKIICDNFMKYIKRKFSHDKVAYWSMTLFNIDVNIAIIFDIVKEIPIVFPNDFLLEGLLMGEPRVGDSRIEEAYECKQMRRLSKNYLSRHSYLEFIKEKCDRNKKKDIVIALCNRIEEIHKEKPRYFSNTKEHRLITRILSVIIGIMSYEANISMKLWSYLMEHNNQENVKILYEIAIKTLSNLESIFKFVENKLKNDKCTPSQRISMIAILYRVFMYDNAVKTPQNLERVSLLLWPLTMSFDFRTRLYAQLVMSALVDDFIKLKIALSDSLRKLNTIIKSILTEVDVNNFEKNIRFQKVSLDSAFDQVMAYTNAPYDEYNFTCFSDSKNEILTNEPAISVSSNSIIQRKLNPTTDFIQNSDLKSYPDFMENVLYVVASLIENNPNLGGIARTCEVFGIKNLVINKKNRTGTSDFQNLSMTAEKNLNIEEVDSSKLVDFILQKKTEGFKIIGAEQTANSCSFETFTFPKRSVLLLGHEKVGIPPNLLGFLDYAVEIPQFGMIRSLNVHVTGALFMWEYCKQHILKCNFKQ